MRVDTMPITEKLALIGAITGIIGTLTGIVALLLNFIQWIKNKADLRISIKPNTFYLDSEPIKVEKTEHGESKTYAPHFHIEVVNIGKLPTTLLNIYAETKRTLFDRLLKRHRMIMSYSSIAFTPHYNQKLPHVLSPGEVWSCRIRQSTLLGISGNGPVLLYINSAHMGKSISKKVPIHKARATEEDQ